VLELGNIVGIVASDAAEVVRWGGLIYFYGGAGGIVSAGICQIGIHADHVRLAIVHGAFIKAPPHLLVGYQKYKRYVKIVSFDTAPWEDLKELITSSAQFKAKSLELNWAQFATKKSWNIISRIFFGNQFN
jgi:Domain of unknown function (DU1801)